MVISSQVAFGSDLHSWNGAGVFRLHLDAGRHLVYLDLIDPLGEGANPEITVTGPSGLVKTFATSHPTFIESLTLFAPLGATVPDVAFTAPVDGAYVIRSPFSQGLVPTDAAYAVDVGPDPTWFAVLTTLGLLLSVVGAASLIFYPIWRRRRDRRRARPASVRVVQQTLGAPPLRNLPAT
jgi:hypothetical protein